MDISAGRIRTSIIIMKKVQGIAMRMLMTTRIRTESKHLFGALRAFSSRLAFKIDTIKKSGSPETLVPGCRFELMAMG